ncbi:MAG: dihydrodipicolinate synthase family protein, partial [Treponema sp.]|nr:dihydrodipicolinate synthase family protein [Treponema sp.]
MNIFRGAFTALITPMTADGSVDFDGFRKNVIFQLEQGIDGLVPLGTTAETPTLDEKPGSEEDKIIKIVFEEVRKYEKSSGKK